MSDKRDKAITKIQKVLNLAGNNPSRNEAESAMLMAQKLLDIHGLEMEDVVGVEELDTKVVDESFTDPTRTPWWKKAIAVVIAENFRCRTYTTTGGGKSHIRFIGTSTDIGIAREVFGYALRTADKGATSYVRRKGREGLPTKGLRNDYMLGFIEGLSVRFARQVESDDSLALAIVTPQAVTDVAEGLNLSRSTGSRINVSGSDQAHSEGFNNAKSYTHISGELE